MTEEERNVLELAARQMAYIQFAPGKLRKPFGFHVFTVDLDKGEWLHLFKGYATGDIMTNEAKNVRDIDDLKRHEAYAHSTAAGRQETNFELPPELVA